ncbi:MAG: hypothetical protein MSA00_09650 [Bacteroidales bacterium]|nr:hypothetical protein [Bacteroidales bacterium]
MDTKALIEDVVSDLGNNKSLKDVSTKIQIIVKLLGDDNLKNWYEAEFVTGYKNLELPSYRIVMAADIKADYLVSQGFGGILKISGQSVPISNLGIELYKKVMTIRFVDAIPAIVDYSLHSKGLFGSLSPDELILVQKVLGDVQIQRTYKIIPPSTYQSIIDNVRSKIINIFMDLNDKVFNGELDMKSHSNNEGISQVITNNFTAGIIQNGSGVIDARHSTITANVGDSLSNDTILELKALADEIERIASDNDQQHSEIAQDIVDIRTELNSAHPNRNLLKKCFKAIVWSAKISYQSLIEETVKKAIELLSQHC